MKRTVKKVKAWAVVTKRGVTVWGNNLANHQHDIFTMKTEAQRVAKEWTEAGVDARAVPCTISFTIPLKKKPNRTRG